jgi:hypothetical protein
MPTRTLAATLIGNRCLLATWTGLLGSPTDDGSAFDVSDFDYESCQVSGTFGVGGSITFQGSNDGTNWVTLTDSANVALTFTSAGGDTPIQQYRFLRPIVTAGDGTTNLVATALARGQRR